MKGGWVYQNHFINVCPPPPPIDKQAVVYQFGAGGMCVQVTELVYGVPFPLMMM